ncbi:MAG: hypothetical protein LBH26_04335 [Treponema sp.]|jgi:hypothetical protein|nr:hypothetical protein [Treponema sp.]
MRPVERFLSLLERLEQARDSGSASASGDRLAREFVNLCAPILGAAAAKDLCAAAFERLKAKRPPACRKLGFIAAFLLDDFDDESMELDDEDWKDIREALEDASAGMNLDVLTTLMGGLLSRGKLDQRPAQPYGTVGRNFRLPPSPRQQADLE